MKHLRPAHRVALAALLSLGPALAGRAQEPEPEGLFVDTISARTVNVDVYVTDRAGQPVRGLRKEDFQLFEDGRPVAISNFYAVEEGEPAARSAVAADGGEPAAEEAPAEGLAAAEALPSDQRLHLVLYVDNRHIAPLHRNRVIRQLLDFLYDVTRAGDEIMLISYDGGVRIEERFSGDVRILSRRLLELSERSGASTGFAGERQEILRAIENAESSVEVAGRIRAEARSLRSELHFTVGALRDTVHTLAGLPGRKAVVYVSDGLPMVPGRDLFYAVQNRFSDFSALSGSMEFDLAREFRELANVANSNRVSFITIDASGLELDGSIRAEHGGGNFDNDMRTAVESVDRANRQDSIRLLAEQTGGVAVLGSNDVRPRLAGAVSSLRTYYSLGFQPSGSGDGTYHRLEVRLARGGVMVRHREGYRDKSPTERMAEKVEASLRFDVGDDPLGLRLDVGAPVAREDSSYLLPVTVRIPLGGVTLLPRGELYVGRLTLFFSAIDPDGGISPVGTEPLTLEIPAADYPDALGKTWTYEAQLLVRPGRQRVAVAVRDDLGGAEAIVGRTVTVDDV